MKTITKSIIPLNQTFYNRDSKRIILWKQCEEQKLDFSAIATFCSLGFMLDNDTFYSKIKVCKPITEYKLSSGNKIVDKQKKWDWHYNPSDKSFYNILEEFSDLLEKLVQKEAKGKKILLPISGGLDSRTLFIPIRKLHNVSLCSYEFEGGINETSYGQELSNKFNVPFYSQKIPRGYLWEKLDKISDLNNEFTDFTHPRQIAVVKNWKGLGDIVPLGHWGDVLFDTHMHLKNYSYDEQLAILKKKILKLGGSELAGDLWKHWGLEGSFESNITDRLDKLYSRINIDHPSARIRAFKSLYWAPRWTSINLSIFSQIGKMVLPYYSDEMCKFICNVPERYLKGRKIQIEYIKKYCPEAAKIPWQKFHPLNLYNYQHFNHPHYYIIRAVRKAKRILQQYFSESPDLITRNWELQFLGDKNLIQLKNNLLNNNKFNKLIPQKIIEDYLEKFQVNPVKYAHSISMLLTLAVFSDKHFSE